MNLPQRSSALRNSLLAQNRVWPSGKASAFGADIVGSNPATRSEADSVAEMGDARRHRDWYDSKS